MIIDSHMHVGKILDFNLTEEKVIAAMKQYQINKGIVSCLEAAEFGHDFDKIPESEQISQREANRRTLNLVQQYPEQLKGQFWIKPHLEGYEEWISEFLAANQEHFCGLKLHPFHSILKPTAEEVVPYIDLAEKLGFPVAVHTAGDIYSDPEHVYQLAQEYPEVDFILVHLGLGTDNQQAISLIGELPNLYGDTTWVEPKAVLEAITKCGSDKILFGTDAPIDGVDTYQAYEKLIVALQRELAREEYQQVMGGNAARLFKI